MPACKGQEGGTARRGEQGWGEAPHLNISTSTSVAQDSGWLWSENCCLFKVGSLGKVDQLRDFGDHIRGTSWSNTAVLDKTESFDLGQKMDIFWTLCIPWTNASRHVGCAGWC